MQAIGRDHRTRELAGLHHVTMANDSIWGIGKETTAALNTITAGITIETVTSTIVTNMVTTTRATTGTIDNGHGSE